MKKKLRIISSVLVVLLMAFFIIRASLNEENEATIINGETDTYKVTVINGNSKAGNVSIAYKNGDEYIDTFKDSYEVNAGTKVKFYFKDGLNEGYNIYMWASYNGETLNPVMDPVDDSTYYKSISLAKTIDSDLTLYVFAKQDKDLVVSFYNSSVTSKRTLIGLDIVAFGEDASFDDFILPDLKGFDFTNWSESFEKVTSNLDIYPIYDANVWTVFRDYYPMFFKGLGVTLLLSVISVFCALFLGMSLCLLRLSNIKIFKFIASVYVEVIRGVPLLLQLLIIYVVLGPSKIHIGSFFTTEVISCLLALFVNSGAYSSEIFRSGIQAVDKGQMEAGRALGMSKWNVMLKIVIPQGIKNSLPSIGNELVTIIKETSLAVSIDASIGELMSVRKQITSATYINLPPYIIVAIIYFCVTFTLSKLIAHLEKRLEHNDL